MLKAQVMEQYKKPIYNLKNEGNLSILIPILLFLFLNTIKVTLFNYFIIPMQTFGTFFYKFEITLLVVLILFPLVFRIKSRIPFIIIYIAQIMYISANMSYYLFYHNYVHIMQWITLFKEAFLSAGHSAAPVNYKMLIILIDMPAFAYIIFKYPKVVGFIAKIRIHRISVAVLSFLIITLIEINNYAHGISVVDLAKDQSRGETPIVERYGTLTNNAVSLYLNKGEKGHEKILVYGSTIENAVQKKNNPNFVAIQVESMDASVINLKYKGQYAAPFLNSLANNNVYYPYVMSYHMGGGTSDSEFSIINSMQALEDYPAIKLSEYEYPNSLIRKLSDATYNTFAFHGNIGDFYDRNKAFPKMGFRSFYDIDKMGMKDTGWGAPDNAVFDFSLDTMKKSTQPFISYTITMTSHTPFTSASNYYNNELYNDIEDTTTKNYLNSISYVDNSIKDYVNKIQSEFKNTYILIWGDHTPNIETEVYKQASMTFDNKYFEFVPLIIVTPDHKVYREQSRVASFLDISPTVLSASGIKYDLKSDGLDLLKTNNQADRKIPFRGGEYDRRELFDNLVKSLSSTETEK